jgi:hypothetical protein
MSHRYPTRFQAKATQATFHAKQPQATVTRVYQTRSQTKKIQEEQRRLADEAALEKTLEYSQALIDQIHKVPTLMEKIEITLLLYQHLYDEPLLLTNYEHFRVATWEKMNEQEYTLLARLQTLPARLAENNAYNMRFREVIHQLLDQMESLRNKYW